ncbi:thermosome subunit alpha [Halocatena pleomorpha]|uniref:Thermosome subunit 1 n=1 Tax=Halocatena pleomorpha TaxID=1785090 RepID=A0A3P3R7K3_9EURY|nr:thermosome subunit alpha [Halocatena pleomorpha]RRJ29416.1 thermosome subunit 1 [Halocatena pleomorpha]
MRIKSGIHQLLPAVNKDAERIHGADAQYANFSAGKALAETVQTTLGPKSLDKMLLTADGKLVVTNDGASILDRMDINHPIAEMVVDVAETQEDTAGDGTTTAVLLTGALLRNAADLIEQGLHPTTISDGYHLAAERACETLQQATIRIDANDPDQLQKIARTVITGKWDNPDARFLAGLAVRAVQAVECDGLIDRRNITQQTVAGGSCRDSEVIDGLVIDMERSSTSMVSPTTAFPRRIEDATIALIDSQLTVETVTGHGTVNFGDPEQRPALLEYEDRVYEECVTTIVDAGADVVFCQKSIDDPIRHFLARENVLAVERTRKDELRKLGRVTGAQHVGSIDHLSAADTGRARVVERRSAGDRELAIVTGGSDSKQVSLLLRGGTAHVVDEMKRILSDCIAVLELTIEHREVLPGGGAIEVMLATDLRDYAVGIEGQAQLAATAFADALEIIPRTLAKNAGMDPIDSLIDLRTRHHAGNHTAGLAVLTGDIQDMVAVGVLEPLTIKRRAITNAQEASNTIIRIDDIIVASADNDIDREHEHGSNTVRTSTGGHPWAIGHSTDGHGH